MSTATTVDRSQPLPPGADAVEAVYSKVGRRLIPLLADRLHDRLPRPDQHRLCATADEADLAFGDAVYGLGAGIFFLGYFLFEVPSNMLLERIGARKTLLRIMVLWGLVAAAMAFVSTPMQFYIARFLLGVFEAGFFPGVILYFTYWFPSVRRGQVIAIFMSATTIISVIAGPLCGATLKYFDGFYGLAGWQWLFIVQGLPAAILGVVIFFYLQDKPADAHWLTQAEKNLLSHNLEHDKKDDRRRDGRRRRANVAGSEGLCAGAGVFPVAGRDLHDGVLAADLDPELGRQGPADDRHLAAIPNACGRDRNDPDWPQLGQVRERRWHFAACVAIAA